MELAKNKGEMTNKNEEKKEIHEAEVAQQDDSIDSSAECAMAGSSQRYVRLNRRNKSHRDYIFFTSLVGVAMFVAHYIFCDDEKNYSCELGDQSKCTLQTSKNNKTHYRIFGIACFVMVLGASLDLLWKKFKARNNLRTNEPEQQPHPANLEVEQQQNPDTTNQEQRVRSRNQKNKQSASNQQL